MANNGQILDEASLCLMGWSAENVCKSQLIQKICQNKTQTHKTRELIASPKQLCLFTAVLRFSYFTS